MNRIALGVLAVAISAAAGSALADHQDYQGSSYNDNRDNSDYDNGRFVSNHPRTDQAQVIRVERINNRRWDNYQREECWNERTRNYEEGYYRDSSGRLYRNGRDSNTDGTIIGAIIGGALGSTVGKGDGRTAATIGGAVIGGAIGNNVDRNNNSYDEYRDNSGTVVRCRMVSDYDSQDRYRSGYYVTYRYAGQNYHAYTHQNPGRYMRVLVDVRPLDQGNSYGGR